MKKHIVAPATLEEIQQTLGVTREDMEIVDRVLKELGYDESDDSPDASLPSRSDPAPDGTPSFYGSPSKARNER
jgi:hypothetical protein